MLTAKQCDIISGLAFTSINIAETAKMLHRRRSTIQYHLKKIQEQTGLDPLDFFDLHELYKMTGGDDDDPQATMSA